MQTGTTAKYRNLIRHIRNWPVYFAAKLKNKFEAVSFVTRGNNLKFRVPTHSLYLVFKEIFLSDFYDIDVLLKRLPPHPIILDIGANAGYFDLLLFSAISDATVYAYEPIAANYALFREHIDLNPLLAQHIQLFNKAVTGSAATEVELFMETDAENSVIASVYSDFDRQNKFSQKVPAISLAQILEQNNIAHADLVKIDCEGSEYPILYETPASCWEKMPLLTIEVHDLDAETRNVRHLSQFLQQHGYQVASVHAHSNCHTLEAIRR
jgi:FkbM family methyltransferase